MTIFPLDYPGVVALGSITCTGVTGGYVRFQGYISGDVEGTVSVGELVRFDVGGDIGGNINHGADLVTPPPLGVIMAGSIAGPIGIHAKYGDIHLVQTTTGPLNAIIEALHGSITRVDSAAGMAGDILAKEGSIGEIRASVIRDPAIYTTPSTITARDGIQNITTFDNGSTPAHIHADIIANYGSTGAIAGDIGAIYSPSGNLRGSIEADSIGTDPFLLALQIAGDLDADVTLTVGLSALERLEVGGVLPAGRTIKIGDSLASFTGISLSEGGLRGQIIINSNNNGGIWAGGVCPCGGDGGVELGTLPFYFNQSSGFGGGAVGRAPFGCHGWDSLPPHGSSTAIASFPKTVTVHHYGPVSWAGAGSPLKIEAKTIGFGSWVDRTADFYVVAATGNNNRVLLVKEQPTHTLGWAAGYEYRITPVTASGNPNRLYCLQVTGAPSVYSYTYQFTITP